MCIHGDDSVHTIIIFSYTPGYHDLFMLKVINHKDKDIANLGLPPSEDDLAFPSRTIIIITYMCVCVCNVC